MVVVEMGSDLYLSACMGSTSDSSFSGSVSVLESCSAFGLTTTREVKSVTKLYLRAISVAFKSIYVITKVKRLGRLFFYSLVRIYLSHCS